MVGAFVLGYSAPTSKEALEPMRTAVGKDGSWQVQEILAQAFTEHCGAMGYERALPQGGHGRAPNLEPERLLQGAPEVAISC
jgi:hypothetical protein